LVIRAISAIRIPMAGVITDTTLLRRMLAFVASVLACSALGCASEDQEAHCPLVATECGEGCAGITARRVLNGCLGKFSVIGCRPSEMGGTLDAGCIRSTADGQLYWLPSGSSDEALLSQEPAWALCTVQDEQSLHGLPHCTP